jgi:acyl dehydratase
VVEASPESSRSRPEPADLALIGRESRPVVFEYGPRQVALYALSVGAGARDTDLIWEASPNGPRVLPSFCLVAMNAIAPQFTDLVHRYRKVEAGETIRIHRPLAPAGRLIVRGLITDLQDKGSFALLVTRIDGSDEQGTPVFEIECSAALLGSGGFAGAVAGGAPAARRPPAARRAPDVEVSAVIPETQAALYQLNGVDDPLHVDPEFARSRGFAGPILHGPCTLGYATRVIVERVCGGDPARLRELGARFAAPVYPGDRLTIDAWIEEDTSASFSARTERGPVLTHGHAAFG